MENTTNIKKTNYNQLEIISRFMGEHEKLAKNSEMNTSEGRLRNAQLWGRLTNKLNAAGPPIKNEKAWRKVWVDMKHKTKKKLSNNKRSIRKTGGGPCEIEHLSPVEEMVSAAAGISAAVEGIAARMFGAINGETNNENELRRSSSPSFCTMAEFNIEGSNELLICSTLDDVAPTMQSLENPKGSSTPRKNQYEQMNKTELLNLSINTHKEFYKDIKLCMDSLIELEKENLSVTKENQLILKEMLELKKKKIESLEKLEREKLELKRLELEIMKVANDLKSIELSKKC